jgi:flavorubredoxin
MKGFHQRYMGSNSIIRLWVKMVRQLDLEMIVPQHGTAFVGKEQVNQFLDWIENLQCGIDLMNDRIFSVPL